MDRESRLLSRQFGHRLEQTALSHASAISSLQTWDSFEAKNYRDVVTRLAGRAFECMEERAGDENENRSIKADHELDAILQFAEYLVACASVQVGSGLFEEFFRSMGLLGPGGLTNENDLTALAWIVRHVLQGQAVPLHVIGKIDREIFSPQATKSVEKLRGLEGFELLFDELHKQANFA
ncbi:hypothetical protein BV898_19260 [Hypsibius exemplaris]|uniref:Uncharacterized protein n=1 Tax=Hypsibius exemplaris TaxID=2072580 RepID=A0A9X6NL55_HYPEX|nr:hypothetical protein BV898_19260 [Hypsibius exemplaris]